MTKITVTEALAELNTINKRLEKKRTFVLNYIGRTAALRDPLEKSGGSAKAITEERQAIHDLEERLIAIRRAIAESNARTIVSVKGRSNTVADWLVWRREIAPGQADFLAKVSGTILRIREDARRRGVSVVGVAVATAGVEAKPEDSIMNVDELALSQESETLEETLGILDGQLSLSNATILVEIKD